VTISLPRWTAVLAIAFIGILGGLAIGQVTHADSSPTATVSYTPPFEITLKEINRSLKAIKSTIGQATVSGTLMEELDKIRGNTYGTCQAAGGNPFCHPF
jgi:hypothetical protein